MRLVYGLRLRLRLGVGRSGSPNLRGKIVRIEAADHPYANREGVVVDQVPCSTFNGSCDCGYDELIVRLDNGVRTNVYEPEAAVL